MNPANDDGAYAAAEAVALRSRGKLIAYLAARIRRRCSCGRCLVGGLCVGIVGVAKTRAVPDNPEGWLLTRGSAEADRPNSAESRRSSSEDEPEQLADAMIADAEDEFPDRRLALLFCLLASGDRLGDPRATDAAGGAGT